MSASAVASATGTSPSADFQAKFTEYNDIHKSLKDPRFSQYTVKHRAIGDEINTASKLPEGTIKESVIKKEAVEQLAGKLPGLTTEYNEIHDGITVNNEKLKELKVRIQHAIAPKQLAAAAAAAKAAQDASTAAQALADAKTAVQTQIDALNALIGERNAAFEQELTLKNQHVLHKLQTVIPNTVDGIKNLLQGEHISQTTRDMVEGIDKDVNTFKSNVDFESIATQFKAKNDAEIAAIQGQIDALTGAMNGVDITAMQSALASTPLRLSTTLGDFISAAEAFIGTLDAKLGKLDSAKVEVEAAASRDLKTFQEEEAKIRELQAAAIADFNKVYNGIHVIEKEFDAQKTVCDNLQTEKTKPQTPQMKQMKSMQLDSSITALKTVLIKFENQINQYLNPSFIQPLTEIESRRTQQGVNAPVQVKKDLETKIGDLNTIKNRLTEEYGKYEVIQEQNKPDMSSTLKPQPPTSIRTGENPRRPVARSTSPKQGWSKEQPLKPMPIPIDEETDVADADIASKPVTPPALMIGERRNFLYVSHNTEPKTAYLVVVKKQRVGESKGGGGGNKNYHVQKGGAPPPVNLPEGSEIFPIDTDNLKFLDIMVSFIPPSDLLTVRQDNDDYIDNPIITEIRSGRRQTGNLNALYENIKRDLITEENRNPLTIGLRAVYYQNIIKLIRLLDNTLNPKRHVHQEMYKKLRKFMDYTYGTFGVLEALFDATFKRNPISPRPNTPQDPPPKINAVFGPEDIKRIVGWKRNTKNTHFAMLFDNFSIICPNGKKNTFLTDDVPATKKNLGSKKTGYNQFRLNWIILLAFHTLYIGNTTSETVGELIKVLYDAFLGWMAMSTHKDTFERMFRNTLVRQTPAQAYSEQVVKRINDINGNDPTLQPLVKAIKDKLCDLQKNPVNPVNHEGEYDDDDNDPNYVLPEGNESDYTSANSGDVIEAGEELELLSTPGFSPRPDGARTRRDRRNPKFPGRTSVKLSSPPGDPDPDSPFNSEVEDNPDPPPRPTLRSWIKQSAAAVNPSHLQLSTRGLESGSDSDSSEFLDAYGSIARTGGVKDLSPTSQTFGHSARSISGTERDALSGPSPSTKNRHATKSNSPPSKNPSPPQNETLFNRRQQIPELDFGQVSGFDSAKSTQLLNRLQQDARRPNTARPRQSQQIQPPSSGSFSARTQSAVERPAIVASSKINPFKRNIKLGNSLPSSSGVSSGTGEVKPVPPSSERDLGVISPRRTLKYENENLRALKGKGQPKGGNRKYTRKRNDKKVYNKPKKTRRRNIQPISSNKNKHTRKRPRT
jgi:hypothetical protein